ncbi:MAG: outer membrane beta-barrel protein [Pseudomonadota bacterium]
MLRIIISLLILLAGSFGHAQYDGDDVYDPFADYSEFEENSQEEADINFFRNGRFFNIALLLGGRMYTGGMANWVEPSASPGLALSYWFNLRLALQFSYTYSQHLLGSFPVDVDDPTAGVVEGNMSVNSLAFDIKYYFNTNNVTRGLADLNPYILAGFSQNTRNFSLVDQTQIAKDDGAGLDLGFGIEIPVSRNEMFIGLQFVYTYVNFSTENRPTPTNPPQFFDGDIMNAHLVFGFNFL